MFANLLKLSLSIFRRSPSLVSTSPAIPHSDPPLFAETVSPENWFFVRNIVPISLISVLLVTFISLGSILWPLLHKDKYKGIPLGKNEAHIEETANIEINWWNSKGTPKTEATIAECEKLDSCNGYQRHGVINFVQLIEQCKKSDSCTGYQHGVAAFAKSMGTFFHKLERKECPHLVILSILYADDGIKPGLRSIADKAFGELETFNADRNKETAPENIRTATKLVHKILTTYCKKT